jgi:drug/metabolite transporter (DMT)-like permease
LTRWFGDAGMALPSWFYMVQWITLSCIMILLNKAILSSLGLNFPLFLTSWHMFLSAVVTRLMARIPSTADMLPAVKDGRVTSKIYVEKIVPVAVLFAFSLALGNQAYLYLSVSFIQMLKAFTPVAVLIAGSAFGMENPTVLQLSIVAFISLGVSITAVGELRFSMLGFLFQLGGIVAEASRLVLADKMLKELKLDSLSAIYYIAPVSFLTIATGFFLFESDRFTWSTAIFDHGAILMLNGGAAFALNIAIVLLISNTSALVLSLGGILKDILLVALSVVFFQAPVSTLQIFGYAISLYSMNVYKDYKANPTEMTQKICDRLASVSTLLGLGSGLSSSSSSSGSGSGSLNAAGADEAGNKLLDGSDGKGDRDRDRERDKDGETLAARFMRSASDVRNEFRAHGVVKI